jgi:hypothetical protein
LISVISLLVLFLTAFKVRMMFAIRRIVIKKNEI